MTTEQRQQINALRQCTFLPGSYDKSFVIGMSNKPDTDELNEKQAAFLAKLFHRYRRQISKRAQP